MPTSCSGPSFSGSLFPGQPWLQPLGLLPLVLRLRLVAALAPLPLPHWGSISARLAAGHLWSGYHFFRLTSPCPNRWCVFCLLARSWRTQPDFAQSKTLKPLSPRRGTDSNSGHLLLDLPRPLAPPPPAPNASSSSHFQHFLPPSLPGLSSAHPDKPPASSSQARRDTRRPTLEPWKLLPLQQGLWD